MAVGRLKAKGRTVNTSVESLPVPGSSSDRRLSEGLREHIELALRSALEISEDAAKPFSAKKSRGAASVRAWLEAGAKLEDGRALFGEPRNAGFAASLEWMVYSVWKNDKYDQTVEKRVEGMAAEILLMLLMAGWRMPVKALDENSIYAPGQPLDILRLESEARRRQLESQTTLAKACRSNRL